jgi:2-hydroxy-6-oxonona-2,4-dienedioate hydrolase
VTLARSLSKRLALLGLAGVAAWFVHDLSQARKRVRIGAQALGTRFGMIEYADVGTGAPTLAIHGASGGFDQSIDMLGALADRGRRLIAPSRFGYLGSAMPPGASAAMQADAFAALLDALGCEAVDVIAISAGAWSALEFAIRHAGRCRSLALIVPAGALPPGVQNRGGAFVRAMFGSDLVAWAVLKIAPLFPALLTPLLGTDVRLIRAADAGERRRIRRLLAHLTPMGPRRLGTELDIRVARDPPRLALDRIACPVLAISAADDGFGTAERAQRIAAAAPRGRAVIFATGGHALVGRHDAALAEVASFFAAQAG